MSYLTLPLTPAMLRRVKQSGNRHAHNLTGKRFGMLRVLGYAGYKFKTRDVLWLCLCDCRERQVYRSTELLHGGVISCGCRRGNRKHGQSAHPLYGTYKGMVGRCADKDNKDYGGRGITVCDRWLAPGGQGFLNFVADMGKRPRGKTLDRIDVNGNYCPENCRWATDKQQAVNKRPRKPGAPIGPSAIQAEVGAITGMEPVV